jgi:hypothetical protein
MDRLTKGNSSRALLRGGVGAGVDLNQLITDFGHTRNLVASSSFQAKASEQRSEATREARHYERCRPPPEEAGSCALWRLSFSSDGEYI